ncbi:hypothetical protein [Jannaschia seohaensis]|uniref:Uncharacterized protein n=1 Tax=Jannaschia seohaensis TaxID=475081 RepID=A0A2Y9AMV0_9RHOB|nr:hypothetical protein [Jannaschia seohaensis]PWJ19079.1 hypothetical protein BCF38_1047 [Jannaschia seohaensis]SSA45690.1 hypothetical protein SAMN05421539_1047 [Jannaschia seohaensis]
MLIVALRALQGEERQGLVGRLEHGPDHGLDRADGKRRQSRVRLAGGRRRSEVVAQRQVEVLGRRAEDVGLDPGPRALVGQEVQGIQLGRAEEANGPAGKARGRGGDERRRRVMVSPFLRAVDGRGHRWRGRRLRRRNWGHMDDGTGARPVLEIGAREEDEHASVMSARNAERLRQFGEVDPC